MVRDVASLSLGERFGLSVFHIRRRLQSIILGRMFLQSGLLGM